MKRRKHRVVVEITFEEPCTAKEACVAFDHQITEGGVPFPWSDRITHVRDAKEFDRVYRAEGTRIQAAQRRKNPNG